MEHNIKIEGKVQLVFPDLVRAAEIFAGAFTKKVEIKEPGQVAPVVAKAEPVKQELPKEEKTVKNTLGYDDTLVVENLHYGQKKDGTVYTKWQDMCKALDKVDSDKAIAVLAQYSENGKYGGVKPADWDKVIKACQDKSQPVVEQTGSTKIYTLEDVRAIAREVQLNKGKEVLAEVFNNFNKSKLSEFVENEYSALMEALQGVA